MIRTIYNNYCLYDNWDVTKQFIIDEYPELCNEVEDAHGNIAYVPSDDTIWNFLYEGDELNWESAWNELKKFFAGERLVMFGTVGRWNGNYSGFEVGSFEELFNDIVKDCAYIKITDEDGHLCLECSHHDGTNSCEFKVLSNKGYDVYDNWEYGYGKFGDYSMQRISKLLIEQNFYSGLPHFFKKVYA